MPVLCFVCVCVCVCGCMMCVMLLYVFFSLLFVGAIERFVFFFFALELVRLMLVMMGGKNLPEHPRCVCLFQYFLFFLLFSSGNQICPKKSFLLPINQLRSPRLMYTCRGSGKERERKERKEKRRSRQTALAPIQKDQAQHPYAHMHILATYSPSTKE